MFSLFGLKRKKTRRPRRYNVPGSPCNKLRKNVCHSNPNCSYTKRGCRRRKGTSGGSLYEGPSLPSGDYTAPSDIGVARSWNPSWGPSPQSGPEFTASGDDDLGAYGDEAGISFFGRRRKARQMGFGGMMSPDAFGTYFGYRRKATKRRSTKRKSSTKRRTTKRKSSTKRRTTKRTYKPRRYTRRAYKPRRRSSGRTSIAAIQSRMDALNKKYGVLPDGTPDPTVPDYKMNDDDEDLGAYAEAAGITFFGRKRKARRYNVPGSACNGLKMRTCRSNPNCSYARKRGCRRRGGTATKGVVYEGPSLQYGRKRHCVRRKTKKCRKLPKAFVKKCRKYGIKTTKKVGNRRVPKKMSVLHKQLKKAMRRSRK